MRRLYGSFFCRICPIADTKTYVSGQIRLECDYRSYFTRGARESGTFVDAATQKVMHRDFGNPSFSVKDNEQNIEVTTKDRTFRVDKKRCLWQSVA